MRSDVWEKARKKLRRWGVPYCVIDLGDSGWRIGECRDGVELVEVRGRKGVFVRCEEGRDKN